MTHPTILATIDLGTVTGGAANKSLEGLIHTGTTNNVQTFQPVGCQPLKQAVPALASALEAKGQDTSGSYLCVAPAKSPQP
jgi:hypothetical protein